MTVRWTSPSGEPYIQMSLTIRWFSLPDKPASPSDEHLKMNLTIRWLSDERHHQMSLTFRWASPSDEHHLCMILTIIRWASLQMQFDVVPRTPLFFYNQRQGGSTEEKHFEFIEYRTPGIRDIELYNALIDLWPLQKWNACYLSLLVFWALGHCLIDRPLCPPPIWCYWKRDKTWEISSALCLTLTRKTIAT